MPEKTAAREPAWRSRRIRRMAVAAVLALGALALAGVGMQGCTAHRRIRGTTGAIATTLADLAADPAHRAEVGRHAVEVFPEFRLGFVELDDQGAFWSRGQLAAVERMVLADGAEDGTRGVLLVAFVHGWQHDCAVCDENVACFREILKGLYNLERLSAFQNDRPPRRIAGVYLGWRGKSSTTPLLQELTFYARKDTAHRIGRGEALELLTRLELLRDRVRAAGGEGSKLIVVGHSFGGALVYSAVSQLFQERLLRSLERPPPRGDGQALVPGFGDLVLLVNPAFEASLYAGIHDAAHSGARFSPRQPAVLLVVSSQTDEATRTWFPLGRSLATLFQRTRGPLQKEALTQTLGNFAPYRTHRMARARGAARGELLPDVREVAPGEARGDADCLCRYLEVTPLPEAEIEAVAGAPGEGTPPPPREAGGGSVFGEVLLSSVPTALPHSPFLVAQASDEIVTAHNGIYNRLFLDFLRAFLLEGERLSAAAPAARPVSPAAGE